MQSFNTNSSTKIITIDGPAAAGKGTIAMKLAEHLKFDYLNSGYIYRALSYYVLGENIEHNNVEKIVSIAKDIKFDDISKLVALDVLDNLQVSKVASIIASLPAVRESLIKLQREFARNKAGIVTDGRDMGTVIFSDAQCKIFINATLEARAYRRFKQLQNNNKNIIYSEVLYELYQRDWRDSNRVSNAMKVAHDALVINTTNLSIDKTFQLVLKLVKIKL